MLRIGDPLIERNDVGFLRHEEVAVEPGARHVSVVLAESARQVGEDLLVQGLDRHFGDVDLAAKALFYNVVLCFQVHVTTIIFNPGDITSFFGNYIC